MVGKKDGAGGGEGAVWEWRIVAVVVVWTLAGL